MYNRLLITNVMHILTLFPFCQIQMTVLLCKTFDRVLLKFESPPPAPLQLDDVIYVWSQIAIFKLVSVYFSDSRPFGFDLSLFARLRSWMPLYGLQLHWRNSGDDCQPICKSRRSLHCNRILSLTKISFFNISCLKNC